MPVSEVSISVSFFSEVKWARDTIVRIKERKIRDLPIGVDPGTSQPDELFCEFAERDLLFLPYVRSARLSLGWPDAYTANISTISTYIERERREEVQSVQAKIREIQTAEAQGLGIGLSLPDGQLDDFARYFVVRELPIAMHSVRGNVGGASAYQENIARLRGYAYAVSTAVYR